MVSLNNTSAKGFVEKDGIRLRYEPLMRYGPITSEMSRINYSKYNGRKYRYFYGLARRDSDLLVRLVRINSDSFNGHTQISS